MRPRAHARAKARDLLPGHPCLLQIQFLSWRGHRVSSNHVALGRCYCPEPIRWIAGWIGSNRSSHVDFSDSTCPFDAPCSFAASASWIIALISLRPIPCENLETSFAVDSKACLLMMCSRPCLALPSSILTAAPIERSPDDNARAPLDAGNSPASRPAAPPAAAALDVAAIDQLTSPNAMAWLTASAATPMAYPAPVCFATSIKKRGFGILPSGSRYL